MKKNYIIIAATAALLLLFASCQEKELEGVGLNGVVGKNEVAFAIGGPSTRSAVALSDVTEQGVKIPLGSDDTGRQFYLEESVIDLNSPVTRGTPVYTENVWKMNPSLFAHSELGDDEYVYKEATGYYSKAYGENIWEYATDKATLNFYMYMPYSITSWGVKAAPTFGVANSKQTISFTYERPATAKNQADIIFAAKQIIKSEYEGTRDDKNNHYAEVLFQHALTGVKFAIGNDEGEGGDIAKYGISINSVSFTGLYDSGNCVVTPTTENGKYQDITDNYSSQAEGVVVWSNLQASNTAISSGDFDGLVTYAEGAGSFQNNGDYPESFSAKANEKNLNDKDATQTFWLIPQPIEEGVILTVNYTVNGKDYTWDIDFGTALNGVVWKAGQLRTYTIRIDEVNVQIEDEVTMAEASTETIVTPWGEKDAISYAGSEKTDVVITNTGNTDAFIRVALIGQWLDEDGNPVFGFTDYTHGIQLVDSWYQDQFVNKHRTHGRFVGLPGYDETALNNGWVLGDDGYYYFTKAVAPGKVTGGMSDDNYVEAPLFTSYTVGSVPAAAVAGVVKNVYFQLEIATQAISAKKSDGSSYTYTEAWANAKAQE